MYVCAVLEQELDDGGMTVLGCQLQRPIVVSMHICAVLEQELNDDGMVVLGCQPQRSIIFSVNVCARAKKQLDSLDVSAPGRVIQRQVYRPMLPFISVFAGLQQRRAVLFHTCSHHGLEHSHVTKPACTRKATTAPGSLNLLSCRRCVPGPGVLL